MSQLTALAARCYIRYVDSYNGGLSRQTPSETLFQLLRKANNTAFGRRYGFEDILRSPDPFVVFRSAVPIHNHTRMRDEWWRRCYDGEPDITWPGLTPFFAMSSGTADATSKHIPVTADLLANVRRVAHRQLCALPGLGVPVSVFGKQVLMLGSSTTLTRRNNFYEGDMSGISMLNTPGWIRGLFIKPTRQIMDLPGWRQRIDAIVKEAHKWNIGTICGVPCWVILLFESLIKHYRLKNIHELWPDLELYIHGGVSFTNYADTFDSLTGKPVARMETYMASEGSMGYQATPGGGIRLVQDAGVFFEFIPFDSATFDEQGDLRREVPAVALEHVQPGIDYAVVISTCGGAWRYLIGDVVNFTNAALKEVRVVGRTRQFLDVCGEHLSVENLTQALHEAAKHHRCNIGEFAVAAEKDGLLFGHRWYVGSDQAIDAKTLADTIDRSLCALNDDYRVMRQSALRHVTVEVLPNDVFYGFLRSQNKEGAMNKFPRVLLGTALQAWQAFISPAGIESNIRRP